MLKLVNGAVLRDGDIVLDDVWVNTTTGKVVDPAEIFFMAKSSQELDEGTVVDCTGCIISPGFIDLQFNGGFGVDFSNLAHVTEEKVQECARRLLETGVTAFCPTLISCSPEEYQKLIPMFDFTDGFETGGASMLGLHLEGPFFSLSKIGAHPLANIKVPSENEIEQVYGSSLHKVRIFTIAPELDGSIEMIQKLIQTDGKHGFQGQGKRVISLGHSSANLREADLGVHAGARMVTHLFNAMGAFHHRDPGIIGLLGRKLEDHSTIHYGLIADGLHAHPVSVAMAYQSHPKGVVLVTDAMAAMGLSPGQYTLGKQTVEIMRDPHTQGLKATLLNQDTLAGSVATLIECVRNFKEFTECSLAHALEAATLHPARAIGIEHAKGTLNVGADGDIVLLDANTLQVKATYIKGKCVYKNKEKSI